VARVLDVTRDALLGDGWKRHLAEQTMRQIQTTWAVSPLKFVYLPYVTLHAHDSNRRAFIRFRPIWSAYNGGFVGYLGLAKKLAVVASKSNEQAG
jgi:hypothetical protein